MMASIDVSVLIPTYNERRFIAECAERMRAQTFEGAVEFLFIDGRSDDGTREFLEDLAREDARVRVLDNPARRTPNALNVGLAAARGEFVARMDAHTFYPPEYLADGVSRLRQGGVDWVSGPALPHGEGKWSRRVALAMESPVGIGAAAFRRLYDDEIEVRTEGQMLSAARMRFSYTVVRRDDQVVAAAGHTVHAAVDPSGRPCRLPERIRQAFA